MHWPLRRAGPWRPTLAPSRGDNDLTRLPQRQRGRVPGNQWLKEPIEIPGPRDMVFLVFVRPAWGFLVFDWEWRPEHEGRPGYPVAWESNFERQIWPGI